MIGQCPQFLKTVRLIEKISRCDVPVLIEGETGTGKELAARAIHYNSVRRDHPFVPVNCGAIPDALFENELFGHQQGAYTDARQAQVGLIANANGGTLFLDEVDTLTPKAQVTLLRFLQDQQYRPLGSQSACLADVRMIAASNVNLCDLTEAGAFRSDLLFRLKIMYLVLPPLRERRGDVTLLATHFLGVCAARFRGGEKMLDPETLLWFDEYRWPGNIRELENLVVREYLLAEDGVIHIPLPAEISSERSARTGNRGDTSGFIEFNVAKSRAICEFERHYLVNALSVACGNVTQAAILVGKERRAFGKLLKKHGIDKAEYARQFR